MSKVICDTSLCSGCLACVVACMDQHYDETNGDAVSPRIYEKHVCEETGLVTYLTRNCRHCKDAPCMKVCPMKVFERTENGFIVPARRDKCIGCKKCIKELGCPAIVINNGNVCIDSSMCTGCRLCSQICPVTAITGGDDHE